MNRSEIRSTLQRIKLLALEIESHVPAENPRATDFRSDLGGLLAVMVCANYETCVKSVIFSYAGRQSDNFKIYTEKKYNKINSKIGIDDLANYAKTFHPEIGKLFQDKMKKRNVRILKTTKIDAKNRYSQLLEWRHTFAHTGARVTTIEEVLNHHMYAKSVIHTFADSFSEFA